ncbi:MAG: hypothetical protein M5Z89_14110 [Olivibacter sp.]|nr:hypothetical protein [Olivibacter sp. UJ_SKK_5.1]
MKLLTTLLFISTISLFYLSGLLLVGCKGSDTAFVESERDKGTIIADSWDNTDPKASLDQEEVRGCIIERTFDSSTKRRLIYYINSDNEIWEVDNVQLFAKVRVGDSVRVLFSRKEPQIFDLNRISFIDLIPIGKCGGSNQDITVRQRDNSRDTRHTVIPLVMPVTRSK